MPALRKSHSSRQNFLPYLKSASSKLNISALGSTTSLSAFFSSSHSHSGSSKSIFMSGIRGIINGKDKENPRTSPTTTPSSKAKKEGITYPEISAPKLSPEALAAVKERFTLIPLGKVEAVAEADMESDEEETGFREKEQVMRFKVTPVQLV